MKLKLMVIVLSALFSFVPVKAYAGWDEGVAAVFLDMTATDLYGGPLIWPVLKNYSKDDFQAYSSKDKRIYLLTNSDKPITQIKVHPRLIKELDKNTNLKALILMDKIKFINKKGEAVKTVDGSSYYDSSTS